MKTRQRSIAATLLLLCALCALCGQPLFGEVNSAVDCISYDGNGSTKTFTVPFGIFSTSTLRVVLRTTATGAEEVQVLNSDFTATDNDSDGDWWDGTPGGSITFSTAPAAGLEVWISRLPPLTQTSDIDGSSYVRLSTVEDAVDKLAVQQQYLRGLSWRALMARETERQAVDMNLPVGWSLSAGYPYWDGDSWGMSSTDLADTAASAFWGNVLTETTLSGSLTAMGGASAIRPLLAVGVINVTDAPYNATGDGVTDDTAAIQAAIDAAEAAGGGIVYLPPGNYYISAALEMSSSVTLRGTGAGATTILHGNDNGIELPASSWYVRLEDFSIKPLTTIADVSYACIYIGSGSRNFSFKRLTIGATSSGHSHPDYGVLSDSTASGSTYMGKFEEVYTRRCRESGVSLIQSYDCSFDRCQFIAYDCTSNVVLKGAGNTFTNCMFSGSPIGLTLWGFSNTFVGCNFELENSGCGLDSYCVLLKYDAGGIYTQARGNRFLGGTWDMSAPAETASSAYVQIEGTARDNLFVVGRWLDTTGNLVRLNDSAYGNSFVGSEIVWPDVIVQESGDEAYNAQTTANGALHLYGTYTYNNGLTVKNGSTAAGYIDLYEDSDNGTNAIRLQPSAAIGADRTFDLLTTGFVKVVCKTIDLDDDASTDDYQFDDDAANTTEQVITLTNILPAYAELVSVQLRCFETVTGSASMSIDVGTTSGRRAPPGRDERGPVSLRQRHSRRELEHARCRPMGDHADLHRLRSGLQPEEPVTDRSPQRHRGHREPPGKARHGPPGTLERSLQTAAG